jgi:hypothetical protein
MIKFVGKLVFVAGLAISLASCGTNLEPVKQQEPVVVKGGGVIIPNPTTFPAILSCSNTGAAQYSCFVSPSSLIGFTESYLSAGNMNVTQVASTNPLTIPFPVIGWSTYQSPTAPQTLNCEGISASLANSPTTVCKIVGLTQPILAPRGAGYLPQYIVVRKNGSSSYGLGNVWSGGISAGIIAEGPVREFLGSGFWYTSSLSEVSRVEAQLESGQGVLMHQPGWSFTGAVDTYQGVLTSEAASGSPTDTYSAGRIWVKNTNPTDPSTPPKYVLFKRVF